MKLIQLSQGKVAKVDDADFEFLSQWKWSAAKSTRTFYAQRTCALDGSKRTVMMHRALLSPDRSQEVDHRDGDGLNNQRENLRCATVLQNRQNRTRKTLGCSSVYKGVFWNAQYRKWEARIWGPDPINPAKRRRIYIGKFYSEEEAARAYDDAARRIQGDFASTNFQAGTAVKQPEHRVENPEDAAGNGAAGCFDSRDALVERSPKSFPVTDPEVDAPDGAIVDGYERVGRTRIRRTP